MAANAPPQGVIAAAATPLTADFTPDTVLLTAHTRRLLGEGCDFVSVFGTTGEAPSLSLQSRMTALDHLADAGLAGRLVPGTGAAAREDAIVLTRHAADLGAAGLLIHPPFYFPAPPFDGLMAYFRPLGEIARDAGIPIILYNYPKMTKVPVIPDLITRRIRGGFRRHQGLIRRLDAAPVLPGHRRRFSCVSGQ
jgi:4-hydroxy-tetrahydrodipicolinate synthase